MPVAACLHVGGGIATFSMEYKWWPREPSVALLGGLACVEKFLNLSLWCQNVPESPRKHDYDDSCNSNQNL